MRLLPTSVQSLKTLRENGYLYVDKTKYIWDLVESGGREYFLSRPRRFGKSLFLSTIEEYFLGRKDLFNGLYIFDKENDRGEKAWLQYPVIKFALSGGSYDTPNGLSEILRQVLLQAESRYEVKPDTEDLAARFKTDIQLICEKCGLPVVVLVDEYDKPLLETEGTEQNENNRELYKAFFSVIKDQDEFIKFVFFTGVTKYSKVSIFSDLNQLKDISLLKKYSSICGITEDEMKAVFEPEIQEMADELRISINDCLKELRMRYDGYHFSENSEGVYNPFSLLNAFFDKEFGDYWFESGTPTFLVKKLTDSSVSLNSLINGISCDSYEMRDYRMDDPDPVPLFYQSGYLTIKSYDRRFDSYELGFPNEEVKYGFLNSLVPSVLGSRAKWNPKLLINLLIHLEAGELDLFFNSLEELFASIPYPEDKAPKYEKEWSRQLFLILSLMGEYTSCEVHMATGRADCVVKTPDYIYVFEFMLDKSVEEAMSQIDDKGYAIPYAADNRKLYKIGVVFSTEKRNVSDYKVS